MSALVTIAVLAKAPVAGRVKTRLCPPCTPDQAARLAAAALEDTMEAAGGVTGARVALVLDGDPIGWTHRGAEVIPQRGNGLDERLAAAFADIGGPTVVVGMDTPQVTSSQLADAVEHLVAPGIDAVLGPAEDGGFWLVGLCTPDDEAFLGVPMSVGRTGAEQLARLRARGLAVQELPERRDVDDWADAVAVAAAAPSTRFAQATTAIREDLARAGVA